MLHLEYSHGAGKEWIADKRRLSLVCAEQISFAIANVKFRDQLRDQLIRDALTGMYNLLETARREFSRATRSNQDVRILSIDVDQFKKFNDNHGHDAGDTVLREMAADGQFPRRRVRAELVLSNRNVDLVEEGLDLAVCIESLTEA
jgi:predicted signal transduction protein with EAL and GGDEF domain